MTAPPFNTATAFRASVTPVAIIVSTKGVAAASSERKNADGVATGRLSAPTDGVGNAGATATDDLVAAVGMLSTGRLGCDILRFVDDAVADNADMHILPLAVGALAGFGRQAVDGL